MTSNKPEQYDEKVKFLARKWSIPREEAQRMLEAQRHG